MEINLELINHQSFYDFWYSNIDNTKEIRLKTPIKIEFINKENNLIFIYDILYRDKCKYFCDECQDYVGYLTLVCQDIFMKKFPINIRIHKVGYEIHDINSITSDLNIETEEFKYIIDNVVNEALKQAVVA